QGLSKDDFKVALAITRSIESLSTLVAYIALGLFTADSVQLVPYLAPGVLLGLPIGFALIQRIQPDMFRRICMSFDAWLVAFGLARVLVQLDLLPQLYAFQVLTLTIVLDAILLRSFFKSRRAQLSIFREPHEIS